MHEVVVGALLREGRVLLVHRRPDKHARPDVWDLPGGAVEAGESTMGALQRELLEELGVTITPGTVVHLGSTLAGPTEDPARLSAWLVLDWEGTPANAAPEEHDGLRWYGVEDLPPEPHVILRSAVVDAMRRHRGSS